MPTARRGHRRALLLMIASLLLAGPSVQADDAAPWLDAGTEVRTLRVADLDRDGKDDLLALSKNGVRIWLGTEKGIAPTPNLTHALAPTTTYVDVSPATGAIHALGAGTLTTLRADREATTTALDDEARAALAWQSSDGFASTRLALGEGVLVPRPDGWSWLREGKPARRIRVEPVRALSAAGPFLEDDTELTVSWPEVVLGTAPSATSGDAARATLWALDERALVAEGPETRTVYDLAFLEADGRRTLVDLDADGRPDVVHQSGTNREGQLAFFLTPQTPSSDATRGPSHAPARGFLRFSGFALEPEFVDLDGDGRLDLVLTTIEVDGTNMIKAITSGRVVARTRSFRNRSADSTNPFRDEPDATITSEVGVRLRFNYAGTIQVERSLTIVTSGDYDGDGKRDLALRTGDTTLRIHRGLDGARWADKGQDFTIPSSADVDTVEGQPLDANGDGKDELALLYVGADGAPDRVRVLVPSAR